MKTKFTEFPVRNLVDIGIVYEYLSENYLIKNLMAKVWINNFRKPDRNFNSSVDVTSFTCYLQMWLGNDIRITIEE